jgi:hypothetical protein
MKTARRGWWMLHVSSKQLTHAIVVSATTMPPEPQQLLWRRCGQVSARAIMGMSTPQYESSEAIRLQAREQRLLCVALKYN